MRLLPVFFCAFLLCSCASGKPQYVPPPKPVVPQPVIQPVAAAAEPAEEIKPVKPVAEDSFLGVLRKEGTPVENIIPRSKEQVAVYNKGDNFRFYYFKRNRLISRKEFPAAEVEALKRAGDYPGAILREMGISE